MKVIALLALVAGLALTSTGCDTPGYTVNERFIQIGRTWDYEGKQIADDVDYTLLLRPSDDLTWWNVK